MGTNEWKRAYSPPPTGSSPEKLKLVREEQTTGEPYHWSPFLAHEGQPGVVSQVKGDVVGMHHAHENNTNILCSQSYRDSYILARPTEHQAARVRYWATNEAAPRAPNQAAVR